MDNDCNGEVDEDYQALLCGVGVCARPQNCVDGAIEECPAVDPATDQDLTCDGIDDDCDGSIDENYLPEACGDNNCGGTTVCNGGQVSCNEDQEPAEDDITCDGVDDDCDGRIDEDFAPESCGIGACAAESACVDGAVVACAPSEPAADDVACDGVDSDCDGQTDEDYAPISCGLGACSAESSCVNGAEQACAPNEPNVDDSVCDGIDTDCDGRTDEDYAPQACGQGVCIAQSSCQNGAEIGCIPNDPRSVDDATCDEVDDNCNGQVDEDCVEVRNTLGLSIAEVEAGHHVIQLAFSQRAPDNLGEALWPTLAAVEFDLGDGYRIADAGSVVAGPSAVRHAPNVQVDPDNLGAVIFFLDIGGSQIPPGVMASIRLELRAGERTMTFDPAGTFFAPEETQDVLSLSNLE